MMLGLALSICSPQQASSFSPTDIANLLAWYRMDLGATIAAGNLTALADQSGTGDPTKNLSFAGTGVIALTAADPAYGNRATATFTGTQRLENAAATWAVTQAQPFTIYFVGHATTNRLFDGRTNNHFVGNNAGLWSMHCGLGFVDAPGTNPTVATVGAVVFNGATSSLYITDPNVAAVTGNPGAMALETLALAALAGGGAPLTGKLAEIISYGGAHDQATRVQAMAYLKARYSL